MRGFGIHTSLWTMEWTPPEAEAAIAAARRLPLDFVEIALLDPGAVSTAHSRALLEAAELGAVCSLGLPEGAWPSRDPERAVPFLTLALQRSAEIGAQALTGVTYGGIGERSGKPPSQEELDGVARALSEAARIAKSLGLQLGIEPINRYESHLLNTGWQAAAMVERIGAENVFVHLDTYRMNIEEKGVARGILDAGEHLRYIHLSESDRGVPGSGTCDWNEIFAALAATGFRGGMAMESFVHLPPQIASGLSIWRDVAESAEEVLRDGLPFLRNRARQYGLI